MSYRENEDNLKRIKRKLKIDLKPPTFNIFLNCLYADLKDAISS